MNKTLLLWSAGIILALICPALVRAGNFTYSWSGPNFIVSDASNNQLNYSNLGGPVPATGSTGPIAISHVALANGNDAVWTNQNYAFQVTITDGAQTGNLTLGGHFSGSLTGGVASWQNSLAPAPTPLHLGNDTFSVKWDAPKNLTGPTDTGALMAEIVVSSAPQCTPEPSSLLLLVMGIAATGAAGWRRKIA
jgi:hypothetical protein